MAAGTHGTPGPAMLSQPLICSWHSMPALAHPCHAQPSPCFVRHAAHASPRYHMHHPHALMAPLSSHRNEQAFYEAGGKLPAGVWEDVLAAVKEVEEVSWGCHADCHVQVGLGPMPCRPLQGQRKPD